MKKVLIALGGNAILDKDPSAEAQIEIVRQTAKKIVSLIEQGNEVIICHGNGPQVGNLLLQQAACDSEGNPAMPLDSSVAMTQGSIGYWIQQAIENELFVRRLQKPVATVVTQTLVSAADPAFSQPTKPIGPFYSEESAQQLTAEGIPMMEDGGRGYRRVVPSPKPLRIIEEEVVKSLVEKGIITIASGGGGIPVVETPAGYVGVEAVIDKDFSAERLAEFLQVDSFVMLTGVEHVFINYNQPNQQKLEQVPWRDMQRFVEEGQFAVGSMLPKVEAAMSFVEVTGKEAIITSLENLENIFSETNRGTVIAC